MKINPYDYVFISSCYGTNAPPVESLLFRLLGRLSCHNNIQDAYINSVNIFLWLSYSELNQKNTREEKLKEKQNRGKQMIKYNNLTRKSSKWKKMYGFNRPLTSAITTGTLKSLEHCAILRGCHGNCLTLQPNWIWCQLLKIWRINRRWIGIIQFVYFAQFSVIVAFKKAQDTLNTSFSVLHWVTSERDWIPVLALLKRFRYVPAAFTKLNVKWIT